MLISGIIYANTAYSRSTLRNDSVVCLYKDNVHIFGIAKQYVSFANEDSISNKHVILMYGLEILSDSIGTDVITGATARHLRHVCLLRLVNMQQSIIVLCIFEIINFAYSYIHKCLFVNPYTHTCRCMPMYMYI